MIHSWVDANPEWLDYPALGGAAITAFATWLTFAILMGFQVGRSRHNMMVGAAVIACAITLWLIRTTEGNSPLIHWGSFLIFGVVPATLTYVLLHPLFGWDDGRPVARHMDTRLGWNIRATLAVAYAIAFVFFLAACVLNPLVGISLMINMVAVSIALVIFYAIRRAVTRERTDSTAGDTTRYGQ